MRYYIRHVNTAKRPPLTIDERKCLLLYLNEGPMRNTLAEKETKVSLAIAQKAAAKGQKLNVPERQTSVRIIGAKMVRLVQLWRHGAE